MQINLQKQPIPSTEPAQHPNTPTPPHYLLQPLLPSHQATHPTETSSPIKQSPITISPQPASSYTTQRQQSPSASPGLPISIDKPIERAPSSPGPATMRPAPWLPTLITGAWPLPCLCRCPGLDEGCRTAIPGGAPLLPWLTILNQGKPSCASQRPATASGDTIVSPEGCIYARGHYTIMHAILSWHASSNSGILEHLKNCKDGSRKTMAGFSAWHPYRA